MLNPKASGAVVQGTSSENASMESCTVYMSGRLNAGPPAVFGNCYSLTVLTIKHPHACKFTFKTMIIRLIKHYKLFSKND